MAKKHFKLRLVFLLVLSILLVFASVISQVHAQDVTPLEKVPEAGEASGGAGETTAKEKYKPATCQYSDTQEYDTDCCNAYPDLCQAKQLPSPQQAPIQREFAYPQAKQAYDEALAALNSGEITSSNLGCGDPCKNTDPTSIMREKVGEEHILCNKPCENRKDESDCRDKCYQIYGPIYNEIDNARQYAMDDYYLAKSQDAAKKSAEEENIKSAAEEENPIIAAYTQEEGNLKEWEEKLRAETGPDSEVSKRLDECEQSKKDIIKRCQQSSEGWSVDVTMDISDSKSAKNYEFQDYKTGGCKKSRKFREPLIVKIDTKFSSTAESSQKGKVSKSHQVTCNMLCSSWSCEDTYIAVVDKYKGPVSIIKNGVTVQIGKDTPVQEGDIIATGEGGEVYLKLVGGYNEQTGNFDDKSYVEVKSNSKLKIIDPEIGAEIIEGDAKPHIEKGSNRKYTITTPTARVVAKGTDFLVSVEANTGKTDIYLYEGILQIVQLPTNEYITLDSNEKVTVDAQALGAPTKISDEKSESVAGIKPESKTSSWVWILIALIAAAAAGYYFLKMRKK